MMKYLVLVNRFIVYFSRYLIGLLLISTTGLLFVNTFLRYVFNFSLTWGEEVARIVFTWMVFLGAGLLAREGGHISLDAFFNMLPEGWKRPGLIAINCVCFLFSFFLFALGFRVAGALFQFDQHSPAAQVPMWLVYSSIPIGGLVMFFGFAEMTIKAWKRIQESEAPKSLEG